VAVIECATFGSGRPLDCVGQCGKRVGSGGVYLALITVGNGLWRTGLFFEPTGPLEKAADAAHGFGRKAFRQYSVTYMMPTPSFG
jgi:hypothetical protein